MKNQKTVNAKAQTTTKKENAKAKIININLSDAMQKKLQSIEVKEKSQKETLYKYPEMFNGEKFNLEKHGKQFRNVLRNKRNRLSDNVLFSAKQYQIKKDKESEIKLQENANAFLSFYKENYLRNDFSLLSITQSKKEDKTEELKIVLEIVKQFA